MATLAERAQAVIERQADGETKDRIASLLEDKIVEWVEEPNWHGKVMGLCMTGVPFPAVAFVIVYLLGDDVDECDYEVTSMWWE